MSLPRSLIKQKIECAGADSYVEDVASGLARAADTATPEQEVLTFLAHVLAAVRCDVYFALELGVLGGWISVASLLATVGNRDFDASFEELLQEIVGTIVGYGYPFPRVPLECVDSEYLKPLLYPFKTPSDEEFLVVLRRVPRNMIGGQENVGYVLWPAALIQSRWLCRHAHEFLHHENRVLEIGAGVGLSGIVASHFCNHVVLSDFNEECLKNLKFNALLNKGSDSINSLPASTKEDSIVSVVKLDWDKLDGLDGNEDSALLVSNSPAGAFERIIGSDIICCKEDVTGVVGVINAYLAKTASARCFFVVASSDHRWGVESFVPALQGAGMAVHWRPLRHSTYKNVFNRHTESRQAWCEDHHATQVSDDELLSGIECIDYYTWLIVQCRWAN